MEITGIKPARHRQTAVFLDGERYLVDTQTFLLSGYRVGDTLTPEQWEELTVNSQNNRAYEKGLYLLDYRAHSKGELVTKISREYPKGAVDYAIAKIEGLGLINDRDFATCLAEELSRVRGYGKARIKADLMRRGIERETIDEVLESLTVDEFSACVQWMQKKYKCLPANPKEQAKVLSGAVRRGFDYATARRALSECLEQSGIESEETSWQFE